MPNNAQINYNRPPKISPLKLLRIKLAARLDRSRAQRQQPRPVNGTQQQPLLRPKKKIFKGTFQVIIIFAIIFGGLLLTTIFLNIIFPSKPATQEEKIVVKQEDSKNPETVQTSDLYKSEFQLNGFKIKSSLPTGWKGVITSSNFSDSNTKLITFFNTIGDRIEILFTPKPTTESPKETKNTGGDETYALTDLNSAGTILGKELFRLKNIDTIVRAQQYSSEYAFQLYGNENNEYRRVFTLKSYNVQIQYFTPGKDFLIYNANDILSTFDSVLKSLTII